MTHVRAASESRGCMLDKGQTDAERSTANGIAAKQQKNVNSLKTISYITNIHLYKEHKRCGRERNCSGGCGADVCDQRVFVSLTSLQT